MKLWLRDARTQGAELRVSGAGSVLQTLFNQPDITGKPIPNYLHVADYMVSFMWQSCCGERIGLHINIVKSVHRTNLGNSDNLFDDHVFNKVNIPWLHEIDYGVFVREWESGGSQRVGILKGEGESRVVQRHLERLSATPLFKSQLDGTHKKVIFKPK